MGAEVSGKPGRQLPHLLAASGGGFGVQRAQHHPSGREGFRQDGVFNHPGPALCFH